MKEKGELMKEEGELMRVFTSGKYYAHTCDVWEVGLTEEGVEAYKTSSMIRSFHREIAESDKGL